jgi:hypothetical protein
VSNVSNSIVPLDAFVTITMAAGVYGAASCGAMATRPLAVNGAGSNVTVIDCKGTSRALYATASIAMTALCVRGGRVAVPSAPSLGNMGFLGGGGVAVVWDISLDGATAVLIDVSFVNNTLFDFESGQGGLDTGGGGLYIAGGGIGVTVLLEGCSFEYNSVVWSEYSASASIGGGGAYLGWLGWEITNVSSYVVNVTVLDCSFVGNTVTRLQGLTSEAGKCSRYQVPFACFASSYVNGKPTQVFLQQVPRIVCYCHTWCVNCCDPRAETDASGGGLSVCGGLAAPVWIVVDGSTFVGNHVTAGAVSCRTVGFSAIALI